VGKGAIKEYQWGRDFLVGAGMNLLTLFASVHWGLITSDDWGKHRQFFILAIAAPYAVIFAIHIVWRVFRAAVAIHLDQAKEITSLKSRLQGIEDAKPNLILKEPDAKHIRTVTLSNVGAVQFVNMRFVNAQKEDGRSTPVQGIAAMVSFWDESGNQRLEMDGKWESTPFPPPIGKTLRDMLQMNFSIEQKESVDVAFWDKWTGQFIAFNNDSFNYEHFWKPGHELGRGPISAKVRLIGNGVDKTFDLKFGRNTEGKVEILD